MRITRFASVSALALSASAFAQLPCPTAGPEVGVGNSPRAAAALDVDGDGLLDVVVASVWSSSPRLDVLLGTGDGGLVPASPIEFPTGNDLVAGDWNGDGIDDLAAPASGIVTVLLGDGAGLSVTSTHAVGPYPISIGAADLDLDGALDLVTADYSNGALDVLAGDGLGGFSPVQTMSVGSKLQGIAFPDLDRDGVLDVAVGDRGSVKLHTLLGDGAGGWHTQTTYPVESEPGAVAVMDLDGDGDEDCVVSNLDTAALSLFHSDGTGALVAAPTVATPAGGHDIALADWNGDGLLDLAVAHHHANELTVLASDGTGGLTTLVTIGTGAFPHDIIAADLDGGGVAELVTAHMNGDSVMVHDLSCPPAISAVGGTPAQSPVIVIAGTGLDTITGASVDGVPASISAQAEDELVVLLPPSAPGFGALELEHDDGVETATVELWPTLGATSTGVGGTVDVELRQGTDGFLILALGEELLHAPFAMAGCWHGLELDPASPLVMIAVEGISASGVWTASIPVANDPSWSGLELHLQAWATEVYVPPYDPCSFTNVATFTL